MIGEIERISAARVSAPAGHYSHATAWNGLVFASVKLGTRDDGSYTADEPFETQVRQALRNVPNVLAEEGCGPERVLRVTAYIVGVENWPAFNRVYAEAFGSAKPARAVVPVAALHHRYLAEIEAIGIRKPPD
jgi:2-iminobutanoate/2-iminopropanoate deaminase